MDAEALVYQINQIADEVSFKLRLSPGLAKILLHQYEWNIQKLNNSLWDAKSRKKFLRAHRIHDSNANIIQSVTECTICLDEKFCFGLEICGHFYCQSCWEEYIKTGVNDEKNWMLTCPTSKCETVLHEEFIITMTPHLYDNYLKIQMDSFVMTSAKFKLCPSPDCGRVVESYSQVSKKCDLRIRPSTFILCRCGTEFCPDCQEESHVPVSCQLLREWDAKMKSSSKEVLTFRWLKKNSKQCPQCTISIQKNGGCEHMTCKNSTCRYEFCWKCMGGWRGHGGNCVESPQAINSNPIKSSKSQKSSLAVLYDNYLKMYETAELKLGKDFNERLDNKVRERVDYLVKKVGDIQPLFDSLNVLKKTQKVAIHSCIFGYYISSIDSGKSSLFIEEINKLNVIVGTLEEKLLNDPIQIADQWISELDVLAKSVETCCNDVLMQAPNLSEPKPSFYEIVSQFFIGLLTQLGNLLGGRIA